MFADIGDLTSNVISSEKNLPLTTIHALSYVLLYGRDCGLHLFWEKNGIKLENIEWPVS